MSIDLFWMRERENDSKGGAERERDRTLRLLQNVTLIS